MEAVGAADIHATVDGEALEGQYCILQYCLSDGTVRTLSHPGEPVSTDRLLGWLCDSCLEDGVTHLWGYGIGYDVSNWLSSLSYDEARVLHHTTWVHLSYFSGLYDVQWVPGRYFKIVRQYRRGRRPCNGKAQVLMVYDLYPFFQRSFIKALEECRLPVPDIIRWGKSRREWFAEDELDQVLAYNGAELASLHRLRLYLLEATVAAGIHPKGWYSPGSLALAAAEQHGDTRCVRPSKLFWLPAAHDAVRRAGPLTSVNQDDAAHVVRSLAVWAYAGGRMETSAIDRFDQVYRYDLVSAYPAAIAQGLPCFCSGHVRILERPSQAERELGRTDGRCIVFVRWSLRNPAHAGEVMWGPFPFRTGGEHLCYPVEAYGYYHVEEIAAAIQALGDVYDIRCAKPRGGPAGVVWEPTCDHVPFSWVPEMFEQRRIAKAQGRVAKAQVYKLILNSLYGKTIDRAGSDVLDETLRGELEALPAFSRLSRQTTGRNPPLYNPWWAGLITARTRAKLLGAIGLGNEAILSLATDGVHTTEPLALPQGSALGMWEAQPPRPAVFLGAGIYVYEGEQPRFRGFSLDGERVTYERLCAILEENRHRLRRQTQELVPVQQRRFVGLHQAVARGPEAYEQVRNTWVDADWHLALTLAPRRALRRDGRWVAPLPHQVTQLVLSNLVISEGMAGVPEADERLVTAEQPDPCPEVEE